MHIIRPIMRPWQHAMVHPCGMHVYPRATSARGNATSASIRATDSIRRIISGEFLLRNTSLGDRVLC